MFKHCLAALSLSALSCAQLAAQAAPESDAENSKVIPAEPLVQVSVSNPGRLLSRLAQTPVGQAMASVEGQRLMTLMLAEIEQPFAMLGLTPEAFLADLSGAQFALSGMESRRWGPRPVLRFQLGGSVVPERIWPLASQGMQAQEVMPARASMAVARGNDLLVRYPEGVVFSDNGAPGEWYSLPTSEADVVVEWNVDSILQAVAGMAPEVGPVLATMPSGELTFQAVPAGIRMQMSMQATAAVATDAVVDAELLARVPTTALAVSAIALDGAAAWEGLAATPLGTDPLLAEQINGILISMGVSSGLEGLISGIKGTALVVVDGGGIWPGVAVMMPRSSELDVLFHTLLKAAGGRAPATGEVIFGQRLTNLPPEVSKMAAMLALGLTDEHWVIGLDSLLTTDLVMGTTGGWETTPAAVALVAEAGERASLMAWMDTRRLVSRFLPFMAMGVADEMPDLAADINAVLHHSVAAIQPSWLVAGMDGENVVLRGEGVFGGSLAAVSALPASAGLVAGMVLPAVTQTRSNADLANAVNNSRRIATAMLASSLETGRAIHSMDALMAQQELPKRLFDYQPVLLDYAANANSRTPTVVTWHEPTSSVILSFGDTSTRSIGNSVALDIWDAANALRAVMDAENRSLTMADWEALLGSPLPF